MTFNPNSVNSHVSEEDLGTGSSSSQSAGAVGDSLASGHGCQVILQPFPMLGR